MKPAFVVRDPSGWYRRPDPHGRRLLLQAPPMHHVPMARIDVTGLGDYIREQRSAAQLSLRQLASTAGVSNPYLSQIERGLRRPSAEILAQIAKGLRISAETLYVRAGILQERAGDEAVTTAIAGDLTLTEQQRSVLLEIYASFQVENDPSRTNGDNPKGTS